MIEIEHQPAPIAFDGDIMCQSGIFSQEGIGQLGIKKVMAPNGTTEIEVPVGKWVPCFKAGPCPCASPCIWVVALTPPGAL